jgi:hypothetical protein
MQLREPTVEEDKRLRGEQRAIEVEAGCGRGMISLEPGDLRTDAPKSGWGGSRLRAVVTET